jgi:glutamate synthase domain-containing protein 1
MFTDTEVVAYLVDLLVRRHGLPAELAVTALAPPFWDEIDAMEGDRHLLHHALRLTYASAMMNGPFAIAVADQDSMVAFTDRSKLRPLVGAEAGDRLYVSSEEAAIRAMEPALDRVFMPRAGEPIVGRCR